MEASFLLACILCAAALYVPGYLVARALAYDRFTAVTFAPAFSVAVLVAMGIVLYQLQVHCPAWALAVMATAFCAVVYLLCRLIARGKGAKEEAQASHGGADGSVAQAEEDFGWRWKAASLSVLIAVVVTVVVYLGGICGLESFSRADDTTVHFSSIRSFLDMGVYSILHCSPYLSPTNAGNFYPGSFYVIVAIVASLFGDAIPFACNAAVVVLIALVFPLAFCRFLVSLFPDERRIVYAGSLLPALFCAFPWCFVEFGQLFGNMLAFMLVPLTLIALMGVVDSRGALRRIGWGVGLVVTLFSIVVSQPNGVFTFGIWAVCWGMWRIGYASGGISRVKRVGAAVLLLVVACALWVAFFFAPPLQSVVTYEVLPSLDPLTALLAGLSFRFTKYGGIQPVLSILVLFGVIRTLKERRLLWLTLAYAFALVLFIIDVSTAGPVKQLLVGFWYADIHRSAGMTALFALPLAALGCGWLFALVDGWFTRHVGARKASGTRTMVIAGVFAIVIIVCQFTPFHINPSSKSGGRPGLVAVQETLAANYSWNWGLTDEEDVFVRKVKETVPAGSLIVNFPNDGSCWSHGVEGVNLYFRRCLKNGLGTSAQSTVLRKSLAQVASSANVRQVLDDLDIRYVMLLDCGTGNDRTVIEKRYKSEDWVGIETIDDNTPGFTAVLSEGNMRLYRID